MTVSFGIGKKALRTKYKEKITTPGFYTIFKGKNELKAPKSMENELTEKHCGRYCAKQLYFIK